MIPTATIELRRATTPITAPVTKFGGEPCWLETPQWPVSRQLGVPMTFLGQVALADVPSLPGELRASGRVAYLFMTESEGEIIHTCEPEGGENAVILQPGGAPALVATTARSADTDTEWVECAVRLTPREEHETTDPRSGRPGTAGMPIPEPGRADDDGSVSGANKLGGVPGFIQHVEYPPGEAPWHLILQLNEENDFGDVAFDPSFGDGRAHVFVSGDGHEGRMLWQHQP